MSSLGEKIKDAFTGHHDHDENNEGKDPSFDHRDSAVGLSPTNAKHDPEMETKQATSAAGNYPYWGDLPREGGEHRPGQTHDQLASESDNGRHVSSLQQKTPNDNRESGHHSAPDKKDAALAGAGGYLASRETHRDTNDEMNKKPLSDNVINPSPARAHNTFEADQSSKYQTGGLAAGAGAAAAGGYLASRGGDNSSQNNSATERASTSAAAQRRSEPTINGGIHNTVIGRGSPTEPKFDQQTTGSNSGYASQYGQDRDRHAMEAGAAVGAGAGVAAAAEKHHRDNDKSERNNSSAAQTQQRHHHQYHQDAAKPYAVQASANNHQQQQQQQQLPAQAAAQQAWNQQDSTAESRFASDSNQSRNTNQLATAAAAGGVGIAGAGATAAYYGQGKQHEQSPRSEESEKVAARAMGGSAFSGSNAVGGGGGRLLGQEGGSRVVHKCRACGVDNDISEYFNNNMRG